jgi:hypothetical protein
VYIVAEASLEQPREFAQRESRLRHRQFDFA